MIWFQSDAEGEFIAYAIIETVAYAREKGIPVVEVRGLAGEEGYDGQKLWICSSRVAEAFKVGLKWLVSTEDYDDDPFAGMGHHYKGVYSDVKFSESHRISDYTEISTEDIEPLN